MEISESRELPQRASGDSSAPRLNGVPSVDECRLPNVPIWGRLGIGAEAWADLQAAKRGVHQHRVSMIALKSSTLLTVMNLLESQ